MKALGVLSIFMIGSLLMVPFAVTADVDADTWNPEETWYCYGDVMLLKYPYDPTGLTIEWVVTCYSGGVLSDEHHYSGATTAAEVGGFDIVHVVQVVSDGDESDSKSIEVIPLGMRSSDKITVRFMDGTREIAREILDGSKSVMLGTTFVDLPEDPSKTNYRFTGWYSDQSCTQRFNPLIPILGDITVYAGWESAGSSSSVEVSGFIVTFNAAEGLLCDVTAKGDRAVSFTVSVKDGYRFDTDSITASVGITRITPVGGVYTLTGINGDTTIEVTGDRLFNVTYDLDNIVLTSEDLGDDHLKASFSPSFGWSGVSIKVIMGGADVTSSSVNGSVVSIAEITGDVIILAQSDLPWIYIVIAVLVVIAIIAAILVVRTRSGRQ